MARLLAQRRSGICTPKKDEAQPYTSNTSRAPNAERNSGWQRNWPVHKPNPSLPILPRFPFFVSLETRTANGSHSRTNCWQIAMQLRCSNQTGGGCCLRLSLGRFVHFWNSFEGGACSYNCSRCDSRSINGTPRYSAAVITLWPAFAAAS